MKISFVITSFKRQVQLDRFQKSLLASDFFCKFDIEVIYVQQGTDQMRLLENICNVDLQVLSIGHPISLSKARNIAITYVSGDIVAFPDDDCWYDTGTLKRVADYYNRNLEVKCICVNQFDPIKNAFHGNRPSNVSCLINYDTLYRYPVSSGIFIRRAVIESGIRFDESLGVGTKYGAGEETDFVRKIMDAGLKVMYLGSINVFHELPLVSLDESVRQRNYSAGIGIVVKRGITGRHLGACAFLMKFIVFSVGGVIFNAFSVKKFIYIGRIRGLVTGLTASQKSDESL